MLLLLPVHRSVIFDTVNLLARHPRDPDRNLRGCARRGAEEEAVVRRDVTIVATDRKPEVMCSDVLAECGIEAHPATIGATHLDPGM